MSQARPKPPVVNQVARWLRTAPEDDLLGLLLHLWTEIGARSGPAVPFGKWVDHYRSDVEPILEPLTQAYDRILGRRQDRGTEATPQPSPEAEQVYLWLRGAEPDDLLLTLFNVSCRARDRWGEELAEPIGRVYDQLVERQRAAWR